MSGIEKSVRTQARSTLPDQFVERADAMKPIKAALDQLTQHDQSGPTSVLMNIYGLTGMGKTVLIRQIFDLCLEHALTGVLLDFGTPNQHRHPDSTHQALPLDQLLEALRTSPALPALRYLPARLSDSTAPVQQSLVHWRHANLAIPQPGEREQQQPVVLLIDHIDEVGDALPFWKGLQLEMLQPLLKEQRALVICTSQSPLYWHDWELRERCQLLKLKPFSQEQTRAFLRPQHRDILAESAHDLTHGHPLQLKQLLATIDQTDQELEQTEQPIDYPLQPIVVQQTFENLSPIARLVLEYVGVVRRFDVDTARLVLDTAVPGWHGAGVPMTLIVTQAMPELSVHQVFEPYQRGRDRIVRVNWRQAITKRLREQQPQVFQAICERLALFYYERFINQPIEFMPALNEFLFFSTVDPDREAWINRWQSRTIALMNRAQIAGQPLVTQLYRDRDLISRLEGLHLLEPIQALVRERLPDLRSIPLLNRSELQRYRQQMLELLASQSPLHQMHDHIPGGLPRVLRMIVMLGESFNLGELTDALAEPQGKVNQAVALLHVCGLVDYFPKERRYSLTTVARSLVEFPDEYADRQQKAEGA